MNVERLRLWNNYQKAFCGNEEFITPTIPEECAHNAHMFYLILKNEEHRDFFITDLKSKGIVSASHYVPLHSSPAGKVFGEFVGEDKYTTGLSSRIVRLPLFYGMTDEQQERVISAVSQFGKKYQAA